MKRNIVCPSKSGFKLLQTWLPSDIRTSSRFFVSHDVWDTIPLASSLPTRHPEPIFIIRNAYTVDAAWVDDQLGSAESMMSLVAASRRYEVRMAAPTLEIMLFESPAIIDAVFGERATDVLRVMGEYDPERAIREAGMTVEGIVEQMSATTIDLLRATPTGKDILEGIAALDAKNATCTCVKH